MTGTYLVGRRKRKHYVEQPPVQVWQPGKGWIDDKRPEPIESNDAAVEWFSRLFRELGRRPAKEDK